MFPPISSVSDTIFLLVPALKPGTESICPEPFSSKGPSVPLLSGLKRHIHLQPVPAPPSRPCSGTWDLRVHNACIAACVGPFPGPMFLRGERTLVCVLLGQRGSCRGWQDRPDTRCAHAAPAGQVD